MKRDEALQLIQSKTENKNLVKHMLAVEACMRRLAGHFNEDEERWALAGLLHDLDYEMTTGDFSRHGFVTADILKEKGIADDIIEAIKAHPGHVERNSNMAKALYAVDPLTGLIVAGALMHPEKSLKAIDTQFVLNRFKEKRFAAGANREQILRCQDMAFKLEDFIGCCLGAMQGIARELGL